MQIQIKIQIQIQIKIQIQIRQIIQIQIRQIHKKGCLCAGLRIRRQVPQLMLPNGEPCLSPGITPWTKWVESTAVAESTPPLGVRLPSSWVSITLIEHTGKLSQDLSVYLLACDNLMYSSGHLIWTTCKLTCFSDYHFRQLLLMFIKFSGVLLYFICLSGLGDLAHLLVGTRWSQYVYIYFICFMYIYTIDITYTYMCVC